MAWRPKDGNIDEAPNNCIAGVVTVACIVTRVPAKCLQYDRAMDDMILLA